MFKKIEIWVLYLFILVSSVFSLLFAIGFGILVNIEVRKETKLGWWSEKALYIAELPFDIRDAIGGLTVRPRFAHQSGLEGTPNVPASYLLLSKYDRGLKESVVELVDLRSFKVLHTWNPDIDLLNSLITQVDEFEFLERDNNNSRNIMVHPKLTADGGLIFTNEQPLRKINVCSNLTFQIANNKYHHSVETDADGNIWAPSHLYPYALPANKVGEDLSTNFLDDAIVKISPDGQILYEKSVSEIFIENKLEHLLFGTTATFNNDPIHLNDIQPVDFDGEYWKKGDVFLSLPSFGMIILYRPSSNEIIWKGTGKYYYQHDVDILDDNRISVFNNNVKAFSGGRVVDGNSEVIIYDFGADEYSYYLRDALAKAKVRTKTQGRSEILPNGDLFIEETNYGRTIYFNADGSLRWSHVNSTNDNEVYRVGWSRILYTDKDLLAVKNLLSTKGTCNE